MFPINSRILNHSPPHIIFQLPRYDKNKYSFHTSKSKNIIDDQYRNKKQYYFNIYGDKRRKSMMESYGEKQWGDYEEKYKNGQKGKKKIWEDQWKGKQGEQGAVNQGNLFDNCKRFPVLIINKKQQENSRGHSRQHSPIKLRISKKRSETISPVHTRSKQITNIDKREQNRENIKNPSMLFNTILIKGSPQLVQNSPSSIKCEINRFKLIATKMQINKKCINYREQYKNKYSNFNNKNKLQSNTQDIFTKCQNNLINSYPSKFISLKGWEGNDFFQQLHFS